MFLNISVFPQTFLEKNADEVLTRHKIRRLHHIGLSYSHNGMISRYLRLTLVTTSSMEFYPMWEYTSIIHSSMVKYSNIEVTEGYSIV